MSKLQWNFNQNSNIFIQENVFESFVGEMAVIFSRPQFVNLYRSIPYPLMHDISRAKR